MTGQKRQFVHDEFRATVNRHSLENDSNTPDWMLADYLIACLDAWNETTKQREKWHGREPEKLPVSQWPKEKVESSG
jgi:hypothetical protein